MGELPYLSASLERCTISVEVVGGYRGSRMKKRRVLGRRSLPVHPSIFLIPPTFLLLCCTSTKVYPKLAILDFIILQGKFVVVSDPAVLEHPDSYLLNEYRPFFKHRDNGFWPHHNGPLSVAVCKRGSTQNVGSRLCCMSRKIPKIQPCQSPKPEAEAFRAAASRHSTHSCPTEHRLFAWIILHVTDANTLAHSVHERASLTTNTLAVPSQREQEMLLSGEQLCDNWFRGKSGPNS